MKIMLEKIGVSVEEKEIKFDFEKKYFIIY